MEDKKKVINALKDMKQFPIKRNNHKTDLSKENPGWVESEEEYLKKQQEWLNKVKK